MQSRQAILFAALAVVIMCGAIAVQAMQRTATPAGDDPLLTFIMAEANPRSQQMVVLLDSGETLAGSHVDLSNDFIELKTATRHTFIRMDRVAALTLIRGAGNQ